MATHARSAAIIGIDAHPIDVEADVAQGLPNFTVVGLPDAAVKEARDRVRAALKNHGLPFPRTRVTINLAPADIRKEGPAYDLPIAAALLAEQGVVPSLDERATRMIVGELALDGSVRPIRGALAIALLAARAGIEELLLPAENADEASLASGVKVVPIRTVSEAVGHLLGTDPISPYAPEDRPGSSTDPSSSAPDISSIIGQSHAKRALEIAAAGGHNLLLVGPPGSGKTMLARALAGILPPMTDAEMLETTAIRSAHGTTLRGLVRDRPFRAPHHTASGAAIVGGGTVPRPGEVSLAHRGVLFLDELPEFPRHVLERLRGPLEDGAVMVARAHGTVRFPSKCMMIGACNPCPCGYAEEPGMSCTCTASQVSAYAKRLSGPLLDRIDIHVRVGRVPPRELLANASLETSMRVRERVNEARERQRTRLAPLGMIVNADMPADAVARLCPLSGEAATMLTAAAERLSLSVRAIVRVIKLSRTIADLDGARDIADAHVAEALGFRERA